MSLDFLNVPEGMLDKPIEPWQPKVGDRVRIVVGDGVDCQCHCGEVHNTGGLAGVTGTVRSVLVSTNRLGHTFDDAVQVDYDQPHRVSCHQIVNGVWLPCELEPIEAAQ